MSDFNKILAFQQVMPYLDKTQQEKLASILGMDIAEIERRLVGKDKEDEFILILLFMDICKSITAFDEGVSQLLKTATSDLLIELNNGQKFMLEIKHTDKEKYAISSGNLQKRIDFANKYDLDLYFAISIKGYWMLFHSSYLKSKNGKIDISDSSKSVLDKTLGCVSYIFPKGLQIKSVYSTEKGVKTIGIEFPPYGKLVSYELYYGKKKIFRVKGERSPYIGYTMILEALQDRLSMGKQDIVQSGAYTVITESFNTDFNAISEYRFLLASVEHTVYDEGGNKYTAHIFVEQAKENSSILDNRFHLGHIRGMMQYLSDNGVEIMYIKNNLIYRLNPRNSSK